MISLGEFLNKCLNQGVDFDGYYGFQCMDLAEVFNSEVVGAPRIGGNAIDAPNRANKNFYDWIVNTPSNAPQAGDLVVWGNQVGQYGHIAIALRGANVNAFQSVDQNWPVGYLTHVVNHNYNGVLGWLRPKNIKIDPDPPKPPEQPAPPIITPPELPIVNEPPAQSNTDTPPQNNNNVNDSRSTENNQETPISNSAENGSTSNLTLDQVLKNYDYMILSYVDKLKIFIAQYLNQIIDYLLKRF